MKSLRVLTALALLPAICAAQTAAPTYGVYVDPQGRSFAEPSVGVNWNTGAVMVLADTFTPVRITFNDATTPATATWTTKQLLVTAISLDPILFTDSVTGRTFVSHLAGKTSLMEYSDNDGDSWLPSQGSGINSGVDHQTVGGGPFAPTLVGPVPTTLYPHAIYYASQDLATAQAAVSLDGGRTFGLAVPMYTLLTCGGIHGHIKVAPDGTAYVPNKDCGGQQGVAVSTDNGITWTVRTVPGTSAGETDPSVGIGSDGTIYLGMANGNGHALVAVSRDKGKTWSQPFDAGASQGVQNTVFAAVVAGDGDRATFYYLGTTTGGGNAYGTDQSFAGAWYPFLATTYDRGLTWTTVNATPNDPTQRGPICTAGTTCTGSTRNLLDFNDITVDKQGRTVAVMADGCISAKCISGINGFDNDYTARATVIRQSTGKGLFAAYDGRF